MSFEQSVSTRAGKSRVVLAAGGAVLKPAFTTKHSHDLHCVDPRVPEGQKSPGAGLWGKIAGIPEAEYAHHLDKQGIKHMTSHPRCGACLIAYLQKYPEERGKPGVQARADAWGSQKIKEFADRNNFGFTELGDADMDEEKAKASKIFLNASATAVVKKEPGYDLTVPTTPRASVAFRAIAGIAKEKSGTQPTVIRMGR